MKSIKSIVWLTFIATFFSMLFFGNAVFAETKKAVIATGNTIGDDDWVATLPITCKEITQSNYNEVNKVTVSFVPQSGGGAKQVQNENGLSIEYCVDATGMDEEDIDITPQHFYTSTNYKSESRYESNISLKTPTAEHPDFRFSSSDNTERGTYTINFYTDTNPLITYEIKVIDPIEIPIYEDYELSGLELIGFQLDDSVKINSTNVYGIYNLKTSENWDDNTRLGRNSFNTTGKEYTKENVFTLEDSRKAGGDLILCSTYPDNQTTDYLVHFKFVKKDKPTISFNKTSFNLSEKPAEMTGTISEGISGWTTTLIDGSTNKVLKDSGNKEIATYTIDGNKVSLDLKGTGSADLKYKLESKPNSQTLPYTAQTVQTLKDEATQNITVTNTNEEGWLTVTSDKIDLIKGNSSSGSKEIDSVTLPEGVTSSTVKVTGVITKIGSKTPTPVSGLKLTPTLVDKKLTVKVEAESGFVWPNDSKEYDIYLYYYTGDKAPTLPNELPESPALTLTVKRVKDWLSETGGELTITKGSENKDALTFTSDSVLNTLNDEDKGTLGAIITTAKNSKGTPVTGLTPTVTYNKEKNQTTVALKIESNFKWPEKVGGEETYNGFLYWTTDGMAPSLESEAINFTIKAVNPNNYRLTQDDIWGFTNFGSTTHTFDTMTSADQEALTRGLVDTDKKAVRDSVNDVRNHNGGHCFGFASSVVLNKLGLFPIENFDNKILNSYKSNTDRKASSIIDYYQLSQGFRIYSDQKAIFSQSHNNAQALSIAVEALKKIDSGGTPILISFSKLGWGGHAIAAYDVKTPTDTSKYNYEIVTYDSNAPTCGDSRFNILCNTDTGAWEIPAYSRDKITGADGAVITNVRTKISEMDFRNYKTGKPSTDVAKVAKALSTGMDQQLEINIKDGELEDLDLKIGGTTVDLEKALNKTDKNTVAFYSEDYLAGSENVKKKIYVMVDESKDITVSKPDGEVDIKLINDDSYRAVKATGVKELNLKPDGVSTAKEISGDYTLQTTKNDTKEGSFDTYTVSGKDTKNLEVEVAKDGIGLKADSLKNVRVEGLDQDNNKTSEKTITTDSSFEDLGSTGDKFEGTSSITSPESPESGTDSSKVTGITIKDSDPIRLSIGSSKKLSVELKPSGARGTVTYSSSNTKIATVSKDGVIKAVAAGTCKITAQCGSYKDTVTVVVENGTKITGITINGNKSGELKVGESLRLTASLKPQTAIATITWSTSDSKVATVGTDGIVKAVGAGNCVISVHCGSFKDSFSLTVKDTPKLTSLVIEGPRQIELKTGQTAVLKAKATPENTGEVLKWTSNNSAAVAVDQQGNLKALAEGKAEISVEAAGLKDTVTVIVKGEAIPSPAPQNPTTEEKTRPVYRLYNQVSSEHLYTNDANEVNVLTSGPDWVSEGVGWNSSESGTPVYRLYNTILADHLYTSDTHEVGVLTGGGDWVSDNGGQPLFYSSGSTPVYRLYNTVSYRHHLTKDFNEYNVLPAHNWVQEGTALYSVG